jgi:hypothetical protein
VEFPPGADGERFKGPRVSFQQEPDVVKISPSPEEYSVIMENNRTDGLDVPLDRYTPYDSSAPTPDLTTPDPIRKPALRQQRSRLGSKRDSEWVFRPLKLKFKVKELEELYRNYVYRQQQSLVFTACLIMVALSVMLVISFLANTKFDLPLSDDHLDTCIDTANLSFTYNQEAATLAHYGELPLLIVFVVFAIAFIIAIVIIVLDRISYTRLIVHSLMVWALMVLQLYALFSINIHRRASDQVYMSPS